MHEPATPWRLATRVSLTVAFAELRRQHPRLSAGRFCGGRDVSDPTLAPWCPAWREQAKRAVRHAPTRLTRVPFSPTP